MNKDQQEIFFKKLEDTLKNYQDSYQPGAWEEFDLNRKQKRSRWPIYYWAAASILILVACALFLINSTKQLKDHQQQLLTKIPQSPKKITDHPKPLHGDDLMSTTEKQVLPLAIKISNNHEISNKLKLKTGHVIFSLVATDSVVKNNSAQGEIAFNSPINTEVLNDQKEPTGVYIKKFPSDLPVLAGSYDSLTNHGPKTIVKSPKLGYALVLAPSLGHQKLAMGAGVELSYPLGSSFSINGGVLYSSFYAQSDKNGTGNGANQTSQVSLSISGIEVPLGLEFRNQSGFYASAGISALGLIDDKLTYSFFQERIISQTTVVAGQATEVFKVVSEKKVEKSKESINDFMGFFNFSAGKKQKIGDINLNIGPFLKVPFNSISSERIKLLQGGIRVGVAF